MFQIALVLDHLWNQISKCCWIFPLLASTLCPVRKSLLPVVNYTINDTEEINSIWPLPPAGCDPTNVAIIWSQPGQMWHQEAQEVAGAVQGAAGDTGHLCGPVTTSHLSSVWLPWPFICPRELGDPCYDNIIPRPCTCLDSSLGRGARSRCSGQAAAWYLNLIQEIQQRINKA